MYSDSYLFRAPSLSMVRCTLRGNTVTPAPSDADQGVVALDSIAKLLLGAFEACAFDDNGGAPDIYLGQLHSEAFAEPPLATSSAYAGGDDELGGVTLPLSSLSDEERQQLLSTRDAAFQSILRVRPGPRGSHACVC